MHVDGETIMVSNLNFFVGVCRFRVSMYDKGREAWIRMLQEIANQAAKPSASS